MSRSKTPKQSSTRNRQPSARSGAHKKTPRLAAMVQGNGSAAAIRRNGARPPTSLRQLLRSGKVSGEVEGSMILQALPEHILKSAEKLDAVVALFSRQGVSIKEWQPPVWLRKPEVRRRNPDDEYGGFRSNDPVRVYLREMGAVSPPTRQGEVEDAKRIEPGEEDQFGRAQV